MKRYMRMKSTFRKEQEKMLESELSLLQSNLKAVNESMSRTITKLDVLHVELKLSDLR